MEDQIQHIHTTIRQDLLENQKDLCNLYNYYTHKYRSNDRLLDINVGIFQDNPHFTTVQIYVADKDTKIREQMKMSNDNVIYDTDIIIKRLN